MRRIRWSALCVAAVLVATGCATSSKPAGELGVEWFEGFRLASFLEAPLELATQADVSRAIASPWRYDSEVVMYTADGEQAGAPFVLHSCAEYFPVQDEQPWPVHEPDARQFMVLAMTCRAAQLVASAAPAKRSHIRSLRFDGRLPDLLPPELAFAISSDSVERIEQAKPDERWRDMFGAGRHEPCREKEGAHCGIYHDSTGGRQQVQLVARGDFNADGIEDVLLSSHNTVEGGTYAAMQMFVLTRRQPGGDFELVRELGY